MKKTVLTWMLLLVAVLAVQAQSLTGKQWCTVLADDDGEDVAVVKNTDNQEIPFYAE